VRVNHVNGEPSVTPSRTAYAAARHRALHQLIDGGKIFSDPYAVRVLGTPPDVLVRDAGIEPWQRMMRGFIAVRTRFAEDALARAVEAGTRQVVVLGAGLDTFALRHPYASLGLRVYEVDQPATQAWKRERLASAGLTAPDSLTFVPVDFEREALSQRLAAAGFDPTRPAFVTWLGVVPYLSTAAVLGTLRYVASFPAGTHVVFDYADPPADLTPDRRALHEERAARVAAIGEPWRTYFRPAELAQTLRGMGLTDIEDLGPGTVATRYFGIPADRMGDAGGHVIRAGRPGASG
jgi:methyltransferase (TIGR00027 family)